MVRRFFILAILVQQLSGCGGENSGDEAQRAESEVRIAAEKPRPSINYRSVYFLVDSPEPVRQIVASDGEKTYRIGSVTVQELLGDIVKDDPIRDIYNFMSPAVEHLCSNGSHVLEQFRKETILDRLYSYSFGCCSDVNEPMLSSLYLAAGFEGHSFRSRHHVAIEVCEATGLCHYADVDHDMFFDGGIDVARAMHGDVATWFEDSLVYKENGVLRPLAAEAEEIPPTEFIFHPGDFIGFTQDPVTSPVLRVYPGEDLRVPPSTKLGIARLSLVPREVGRVDDCVSYRVRFPYVLNGATVYPYGADTPLELAANGRYELEFELCQDGPEVKPEKHVLWLSFQYNSLIFPDMNYLSAAGAKVIKSASSYPVDIRRPPTDLEVLDR